MQGMPGALQVLAALLHDVQTIYTYDGNREPVIFGQLDLTAAQVAQATIFFQPHSMWLGSPSLSRRTPQGEALTSRLGSTNALDQGGNSSLREGPHLPGGTVLRDLVYGYAVDASLEPEWLVTTDGQQQRSAQDCTFEACTECTFMTHGECSQSSMPPDLNWSCHRDQTC